nr:phospholipase A1-II 4-like [Ipomoea batatas]
MSGIADRWSVLSGSDNWEGLLEPLDSDLRRYLIHYGTMIEAARDAFIEDDASKNVGLPRYARRNLFQNTGLLKGNPFKYEVTKYFYATSELAIWKESDWIGYVAVATDEGKVALGRRDIVVVWRGTIRELEWIDDAIFLFVNAPLIFGQNSDPLVHEGWHYMYTTTTDKDNGKSPRDQKMTISDILEQPLHLRGKLNGRMSLDTMPFGLALRSSTWKAPRTNCKDVSRDAPFVFDFVVPESIGENYEVKEYHGWKFIMYELITFSEKLNVEGSTVTLTPSGERISTVYDELASPTFVTVLVYVCDPDVDVVFTRFREKEG